MMKIVIRKTEDYFYTVFEVDNGRTIVVDSQIAGEILNIEVKEYQKIMAERFKAVILKRGIYYRTREDAEIAVRDYLESMFILYLLARAV